jgi:long-chain acyl-CoA synthetase
MSKDYYQYVKDFTATGQLFEYTEITNSAGITYKEFINAPKTLKDYFELGYLHPETDWLVFNDERYTFKQIHDQAKKTANALLSSGFVKGDRVAVCMANNPEYMSIYMGCMLAGLVFVPLNSWWVPNEIIYGLENSGSKVLIADQKRLQGLDGINILKLSVRSDSSEIDSFEDFISHASSESPAIEIDTNDQATIFYTSGSTGYPKGVLSSHRNVLATLFSWALFFTVRSEMANDEKSDNSMDKEENIPPSILHCVPLFHVTGSHAGFLMSVLSGRKMVLMSKWDAGLALKLIQNEKITAITGVPTQTWDLLNHPDRDKYDLSSLADLSGGGAPRPPEHVKRLNDEMDGRPSIGYGLSETNALGTLNAGDDYLKHPSSCGRAVPPVTDVAVVDQDWNFLKEGDHGEVVIKSPANMIGYWDNPDATDEVFNDEGWFKTGDLGYMKDEFLFIVDRVKDLVIRGGENISCIEVESAIAEHQAVREVAVFGIPDERLGEVLCAAIYSENPNLIDDQAIKDFLGDKLAAFQIPEHIIIFDEALPKIASGKFSKPEMRDNFVTSLKK